MDDRIAVLGAGSLGCFIGGALAAAGATVTLIGRPRVIDGIRNHGLHLTDLYGRDEHLPPQALTLEIAPAALAGARVILVTVKSKDTAQAAVDIAAHADPNTIVVSFQNGLGNAPLLKAALPACRVLAGMVFFNVVAQGHGRWHRGTAGDLWVEEHGAVGYFAPPFTVAQLPLKTSDNMAGVQWSKLLVNLNNALNALAGVPLVEELADRDYRWLFAGLIEEGLAVARAAGITLVPVTAVAPERLPGLLRLPNWLYGLMAARTTKLDPLARTSMWEDLEAGRPTEIDALQGEIVRQGAALGVPTPLNARVADLVRAAERGGQRDWRGKDLRQTLLTH